MAINETLSPTASVSTVTAPTQGVSEVSIESQGGGNVWLEQLVPGGKWMPIYSDTGPTALSTPDTGVSYRFNSRGLTKDVLVYFGP